MMAVWLFLSSLSSSSRKTEGVNDSFCSRSS